MQYDVAINGQLKQITVVRRNGGFAVSLGEREWVVDAAQVEGHTLSLLIEEVTAGSPDRGAAVSSREISIAPPANFAASDSSPSNSATENFWPLT